MYVGVAVGFRAWKINAEGGLTSAMIVKESQQSQVRGLPSHGVAFGYSPVFQTWKPGRYEAKCLDVPVRRTEDWCMPHEDGPADGCTCGIYCFKRVLDVLNEFENGSLNVIGVVALWGKIIVHEHGARAQYGTPICFADQFVDGKRWTNAQRPLDWKQRKDAAVDLYGIPEVRIQDLEDIALGHGSPLDEFS